MDYDSAQLTESQLEKLRQFQEVTQLDETELAIVTLASLDWNLESAITAQINGGIEHAPTPAAQDDVRSLQRAQEMMEQDEVEMMEQPRRSPLAPVAVMGHNAQRATAGAGGPSSRSTSDTGSGRGPARSARMDSDDSDDDYDYAMETQHDDDDEDIVARRPASASNGGSSSGSNDFAVPLIPMDCESALEGTQNFQSVFEARYGANGRGHMMPPFFIGSLQSAIREAFECPDRPVCERRPLALYIHHDGSIARNIFPQAVMCNEQVLQLLRSQFIVWPWDVTAKDNENKLTGWLNDCSIYDELEMHLGSRRHIGPMMVRRGMAVRRGIRDARPIISSFLSKIDRFPLLILLSKEGSQLRMVDFLNSNDTADSAMEKLLVCMDTFATFKLTLEKQEQERNEREALRREQDRELQESLTMDREKKEKQEREAREAKEAEERLQKEKDEKEAHIAALKASLPAEPADGAPDCCTVRFRLPEQGNSVRRFSKSDPFSVFLTFLESEGFPVASYRMMNSDFPQKKDVSTWDPKTTLAELKWPAREVINVEER